MLKLTNLFFLIILHLSGTAFATIYKCEENGKIIYQDKKCDHGLETIPKIQDKDKTTPILSSPPPATAPINQPTTPSKSSQPTH